MKKNSVLCSFSQDGISPRAVMVGMAVFSIVLLLLNGSFLFDGVSHLEYGTNERIFWTKVLRPLDTLSRDLSFSEVRTLVRDTAGAWLNAEP